MITVYFAVAVLSIWTLTDAAFDVTIGYGHTCAINEGEGVECWGENGNGELGLGHTTDMYEPTDTVDLGTDFEPKEVGCGDHHCCSLSTAASIKCWGWNLWGQLGYGDTNNRGDTAGEMGDDLKVVQLPTNFIPDHLVVYIPVTCVVSTESQIVCFGKNDYGQCGVGHSSNIGDGANEMGDYLVAVDLGGDFDLAHLGGGSHSPCAVSTVGAVKCWGWNHYGQLGLGDTSHRGDSSNEMGDFLPYLDLGTEFYATSVHCGGWHCCTVSTDGELKCMGRNSYGQLGQEDTTHRGDNAGEMGDHLVAVSMGADFSVAQVKCTLYSTCARSTSADIKCFGYNNYGQLGYGDTTTRGSTAGSMGDALSVVDIGSGFTENGLRLATSDGGASHMCAFEESTELLLQCWGWNNKGQLGYGDSNNRGDGSDEMGNNLPFVDHGFTAQPICDADALNEVVWHDLLNDDEYNMTLLRDHSVAFNASSLSLTFSASLKYVGLSADGNFDHDFNLGSSYWIGFQSFLAGTGGIDEPGSCGNREAVDYDGLDFADSWTYPTNPDDLATVPTAERMAYPPSDWTLTAESCNEVEYERTFSWTELASCSDDAGDSALVQVVQTNETVTLSGTFYVELLSPYSMSSSDYYRTAVLLQQPFGIVLMRQINVIASTGVSLFICSVMGYGRADDGGNYSVTILVQSADFVELGMDEDVVAISWPEGVDVLDIETVTSSCLVASSFTCGQIFEMTVAAECSDDENTADLSGNYQFGFSPRCRVDDAGNTKPACDTFMDSLDGSDVSLDLDTTFVDDCSANLFNVTFVGDLQFYPNASFIEPVNTDSDPFVIGQDTIFGKVTVAIPKDPEGATYDFVNVSIETVVVCTADPGNVLSVDADTGNGGCFSAMRDSDGPYRVIGSGADSDYLGTRLYSSGNEATFSFLTFATPRETIYVHVQLLLTMETTASGEARRRRVMLQTSGSTTSEGNAFQSYVGTASVQEADNQDIDTPLETDGAAAFSVGFMPAMIAVIGWMMN